MTFGKFDTMVTVEETFCEEWDSFCKADWLAVQAELEMEEASAELLDQWEEDWEEVESDPKVVSPLVVTTYVKIFFCFSLYFSKVVG